MKIILFCNRQGNQQALAVRLHDVICLHSIVLCDYKPKKISFLNLLTSRASKVITHLFGGFIFRGIWFRLLEHYNSLYPSFPFEPRLVVRNINDQKVIDYIHVEKPELVLVSGTNLLRIELINSIGIYGKIMNLHTGISPFIKGGPNCTNWCLYLRRFNLIGNTVMWLDPGIDTGNLIATSRTELSGRETLFELHLKVMDHAHKLFCNIVVSYISGTMLPSVPQCSIANGKLFLTRDWGLIQNVLALLNFYLLYRPGTKYLLPNPSDKLVE